MDTVDRREEQLNIADLTDAQAEDLCRELREEIIRTVAKTGGHLASNLGLVEFTVALHRVFDTGRDRLVFDVGHQCYAHKMLTGRRGLMGTLRSFGGISGYPKPAESVHDAFIAGHASNSVSVAVGMARARTLLHEDYSVIALIGDGALTGGLAYEGLSDAGQSDEKLLVVLNDNGMSITKNVGGIAQHLAGQRLKPQYLTLKKYYRKLTSLTAPGRWLYRLTHRIKKGIKSVLLPCSIFEDIGFTYLGPVDGHDVKGLTRVLRYAKDLPGPVLLHIKTVKGRGYGPAETDPDEYHGVSQYDVATGAQLHPAKWNFSLNFGQTMCDLAQHNPKLCAVTAAMMPGTGLDEFARRYPERCFDVGIAEGHAVAMCAGMAKQGLTPVFAVYSTFLQRGYDMLIHDVAIQGLHVVFAVDRAGLVGEDGETHHGVFDVSYLSDVPGVTILAPSSFAEQARMLRQAVEEYHGPVAVRYPRGGEGAYREDSGPDRAVLLRTGGDITLAGYGTMINRLLELADRLAGDGIEAEIVKFNDLTHLDWDLIAASVRKTGRLLTAEDCVANGSVGQKLAAGLEERGIPAKTALCSLGMRFLPQGSVDQLMAFAGLDSAGLYRRAKEICTDGEKASGCAPDGAGAGGEPPEGPGLDHERPGVCGRPAGG